LPFLILNANILQHVAMSLGDPPKPVEDPDWTGVNFLNFKPIKTADFVVNCSKINFDPFIFGNL